MRRLLYIFSAWRGTGRPTLPRRVESGTHAVEPRVRSARALRTGPRAGYFQRRGKAQPLGLGGGARAAPRPLPRRTCALLALCEPDRVLLQAGLKAEPQPDPLPPPPGLDTGLGSGSPRGTADPRATVARPSLSWIRGVRPASSDPNPRCIWTDPWPDLPPPPRFLVAVAPGLFPTPSCPHLRSPVHMRAPPALLSPAPAASLKRAKPALATSSQGSAPTRLPALLPSTSLHTTGCLCHLSWFCSVDGRMRAGRGGGSATASSLTLDPWPAQAGTQ